MSGRLHQKLVALSHDPSPDDVRRYLAARHALAELPAAPGLSARRVREAVTRPTEELARERPVRRLVELSGGLERRQRPGVGRGRRRRSTSPQAQA